MVCITFRQGILRFKRPLFLNIQRMWKLFAYWLELISISNEGNGVVGGNAAYLLPLK